MSAVLSAVLWTLYLLRYVQLYMTFCILVSCLRTIFPTAPEPGVVLIDRRET